VTAQTDARIAPGSVFTEATRPLFLMGNKRSGTSLLVRLLNAHPNVFVTREADVIWILYQLQNGGLDTLTRYEWDGSVGFQRTLEATRELLGAWAGRNPDIRALFESVQELLMRGDAAAAGADMKREVLWVGDKKPVQHADPEIRAFLKENFADARYLHIVRHPTAAIGSMSEVATKWKSGVPPYWRSSADEILERWTIHEEWVLDARHVDLMPVHTLRLEDLAREPVETFRGVLAFLGLKMSSDIEDTLKQNVSPAPNEKYRGRQLQFSERARRVMELYGYFDSVDG
jgi:hypothetical protein